ncbi:hypothetical protein BGZ70_004407 [Mortierella alpina]|uniref:Uncharacterized protein n=1 Tax=Mortierella alpina TaxID=64518 RepID=A0A9P6JAB8_MORAP|nr:hypothetical protein BGZ70_004407 [Mortierella alpina]
MPPDPTSVSPPPVSIPPSSSSSPSSTVSSRRLRRLLVSLSVLLLSTSPLLLTPVDALSCLCPAAVSAGGRSSNQLFDLTWTLTDLDTAVYDALSAELFCMDSTGVSAGEWQATSRLFTNRTIDSTGGQYQVSLASCGPLARNGAIRMVAESLSTGLWDEKTCYFSIFQTFSLVPDPPVDPPPSQQPIAPEKPTATTNPPEEATRAPRIGNPEPTANPTINPKVPGGTTAPNPTPGGDTLPTNNPNASPINPGSQPTPNPSQSGPGSGGLFGGPQASQPTNGGGDGGGGGGGPAPSSPPPAQLPNGSGVSSAEDSTHREKIKTITAALSSVGTAACLALVVLSLLVIRKRRKERRMNSGGGHKTLPRSMAPGARAGLGGGAGGAMRESKMRFTLKRSPKEGYFYQMDDNDTDIEIDSHSGEAFDEKSGNRSGIDTMQATTSHQTRPTSMVEDGAGVHQRSVMASVPPLKPLQYAHLEPLPAGFDRQRRSSLPLTDPASSAFSMSSYRSSFETSSVIRKYWAASMAVRAERRAEGHPPSTRDLEDGRSGYSYYDEGSVFGDGSRDSDSRLADIMSMRTTGSGHSAATTRRPYRRNTLNSFGAYSFGQTETTTMSLSSIPDSLMISEDEFLERLRAHELEQEELYLQAQQHGQQYSDEGDEEEHAYYPHPHHRHPHPYYHHGHGSIISRRTSSVPSLTSSTDPFKTFDSNEVLMDVDHTSTEDLDPFSDDRALSRTSSTQSGHPRHHEYHHHQQQQRLHDGYGYPPYMTQAQQESGDGPKARLPTVQPLPAYPPPSAPPY